ncbi:MAG: hypothetical protein K2X01_12125 [Cyanobacteria bacterium]|nr:hypothetical protein [Cyanobacteriota bacterium]
MLNHLSLRATGFRSPAEDFTQQNRPFGISLDETLITHPAATFFFTLESPLMDLQVGDTLVVDRAIPITPHCLALLYDETTTQWQLQSGKSVIAQTNNTQKILWGVVTYAIRPLSDR